MISTPQNRVKKMLERIHVLEEVQKHWKAEHQKVLKEKYDAQGWAIFLGVVGYVGWFLFLWG